MNIWEKLIAPRVSLQRRAGTILIFWTVFATCSFGFVGPAFAADAPAQVTEHAPVAFDGEKSAWHGFGRYDFLMDENSLAIKPITAEDDEKDGVKHQVQGQRRCIIVVPGAAPSRNPWSWRGVLLGPPPPDRNRAAQTRMFR